MAALRSGPTRRKITIYGWSTRLPNTAGSARRLPESAISGLTTRIGSIRKTRTVRRCRGAELNTSPHRLQSDPILRSLGCLRPREGRNPVTELTEDQIHQPQRHGYRSCRTQTGLASPQVHRGRISGTHNLARGQPEPQRAILTERPSAVTHPTDTPTACARAKMSTPSWGFVANPISAAISAPHSDQRPRSTTWAGKARGPPTPAHARSHGPKSSRADNCRSSRWCRCTGEPLPPTGHPS